jgi:hypothetical protein
MSQEKIPLSNLLAIEWSSAIASSAMVAPFISIIDKAIFSNASGREPLSKSIVSGLSTLVTKPIYFFRQPSFLFIWGVYSGTYVVANTIQGICDRDEIPWQIPKFIGSSTANVTLSVLKDLYFTRAFGVGSIRPVPLISYQLYMVRDCMTIGASFNLPDIVASKIVESSSISPFAAATAAQLITPCAIQFLSSPLHLLGMDIYNRGSASWPERRSFIAREYVKTSFARVGRIFPAFGIGGVANKFLRKHGYTALKNE